jgi:hypothetical protein
MHAEQLALAQLRARVIADATLQQRLGQLEDPASFAALAARCAAALGIGLRADAIAACLTPDPLGLSRWTANAVRGLDWPSSQWLPIQVAAVEGELGVDWAHFGDRPLREPLFEGDIRRVLDRPINRLVRYRMRLDDFVARAEVAPSLKPDGFIFHMSRCGSTLVSRMLAALPQTIVVSEAAPIDALVQLGRAAPDAAAAAAALRAMVAGFGRKRVGHERHYVIKLDFWHTLALPLFRRAFPDVPWVFLYRDPVEVLVSQMRERGPQTMPEIVPPRFYGIDAGGGMTNEDYCARVLAAVCQAVIDHRGAGGGLLINFRALPAAVWTTILPHFGLAASERECAAMRHAARQDAKMPLSHFADDSQAKQREATPPIRAAADRHLQNIYEQFEALRV